VLVSWDNDKLTQKWFYTLVDVIVYVFMSTETYLFIFQLSSNCYFIWKGLFFMWIRFLWTFEAMGDAIDLSGDGGVLKKIVRSAKPDAISPSDDLPVVDGMFLRLTSDQGQYIVHLLLMLLLIICVDEGP